MMFTSVLTKKVPNIHPIRVIGSGSFGYVFEAIDQTTKQRVALKRVEKVGKSLSREYEILMLVKDCDNVVRLLDFFYTKTNDQKTIQNLVLEYMEDNLENRIQAYIKLDKQFTDLSVKEISYQIFQGLQQIHSKQIAHRDLKPENILIDRNEKVKICDFGSSKIIDKNGKNTPYVVSRYYRAPELLLCITNYTQAIDVWSAGCIMAELVLREPLFQGRTEGDQLFQILKVMGSIKPKDAEELQKRISSSDIIIATFRQYKGIDLREKFRGIIKDLDNFIDLLQKCLVYIPENRITAAQALKHPFFKEIIV
ncbi:hypothetical protein pb186bvf_018186 [Paramecium bursaria]